MKSIELVITPKVKNLGDNFEVRRSLPNIKKQMVGPFIFWDHMGPVVLEGDKEMKVRSHPHIGLATITWLFSGEILHRDNLGNEQNIRPGEVNWMTAGSGIVHSERSFPKVPAETLEGIQLWVALPKEKEEVDASFFHCKIEDVPSIQIPGFNFNLVAGQAFGKTSPVPVYSKMFYLNGKGSRGSQLNMDVDSDSEGAVYVVEGAIEVEGQTYSRFDLVIFKKGSPINFTVTEDARVMIFGGEVLPEKRKIWWNFVSTSSDKIEAAKQNWLEQKYPKVINEVEFAPLPKIVGDHN